MSVEDWAEIRRLHRSEGHQQFLPEGDTERPVHEVQQLTLNMIRELVGEGLFLLGTSAGVRRRSARAGAALHLCGR
jgi:hypothetical protein